MFRNTYLIELSELFECRVAGPTIHWPLEAFLDNLDKANLFKQSFALFPSVEGLSPLHRHITDGLTPGVVEVIRAQRVIVTDLRGISLVKL